MTSQASSSSDASLPTRVRTDSHVYLASIEQRRSAAITRQDRLHEAAYHGRKSSVRKLLQSRVSVDACNSKGRTALQFAAEAGRESVVHDLLEEGAEVNAKNHTGQTVLHFAARRGFKQLVTHLAKTGAEVDACSKDTETALHVAVAHGNKPAAKELLHARANPSKANKDGCTPLHLAAKAAAFELLGTLELNAVDAKGWTALHFAADVGDKPCMKHLLGEGQIRVDARSNEQQTALHLVAARDHSHLVTLLLEKEAECL